MTVSDEVMRLRKLTEDIIREDEKAAEVGFERAFQKLLPDIEKSAMEGRYELFTTTILVNDYGLERYLENMGFVIKESNGFHIISWKEVFLPTLDRNNFHWLEPPTDEVVYKG
jgi:hypothetical protein